MLLCRLGCGLRSYRGLRGLRLCRWLCWLGCGLRLYGLLEREGVKITRDVDAAPFIEAVAPVYDQLTPPQRALVERIRAADGSQ